MKRGSYLSSLGAGTRYKALQKIQAPGCSVGSTRPEASRLYVPTKETVA